MYTITIYNKAGHEYVYKKMLGKTPERVMWRMASMWRRYRGYDHGQPGGIAVDSSDACEASMVMPVVAGCDTLAEKRSGSNLKNEFSCFFGR